MSKALLAALVAASVSGSAVAENRQDRIANEGTVGTHWMLAEGAGLPGPTYPAHLAARGANVCVALGYRIHPDGSTSDFSVLKQWNSESGSSEPIDGFWHAFAEAGATAVSQWRFQPRPGITPEPTYTVATLGFEGGRTPGDAVGRNCRIADLASHLAHVMPELVEDQDRARLQHDRMHNKVRQARDAAMDTRLRRHPHEGI